ncbi:MAG: Fe-S cluster assembly protein SufD [Acidimicrobiaceae bacterium]|nr:Fe-S cluster assembly protein SufD [Acidimicrobiaceae bacterium]
MATASANSFSADAARALAGPEWLRERRAAAAEELAAAALPTTAAEQWRYSAIADFDPDAYRPAAAEAGSSQAQASPGALSAAAQAAALFDCDASETAAVIDVADGRIVALRGAGELASQGVRVGALADSPGGAELIGAVASGSADYFTVFNDAFTDTPILVDVPAGVEVDGVITIRHHLGTAKTAAFPRLLVRVAENSAATVLDVQRCGTAALLVPVVELDVAAGARLGYVNLQNHHRKAWQIAAHTARVEREASLTVASLALGGGYARTRTDTRLVGRGAGGDLLSAYFGSGDQILDFRTYQDHAAADTASNLLFKGAVGESARSVYTGLIRVRPEARGTNAVQTNRNLKLSEDAWAESVPNLEIENNEVRCAHASAVGPVDADQVFYLESRGVPTAVAERLIVAGFFDEVLEAFPVESAAQAARSAVAVKFNQMLNATAEAAA